MSRRAFAVALGLVAVSGWESILLRAQGAAPGTPLSVIARVLDSTVVIGWRPGPGDLPERFLVEATMAPGGPVIARLPVPAPPLIVTSVPNGTYYVRVQAVNGAGSSAPSAEVQVRLPCGPPSPPENLTQGGAGGVISLAWNAPSEGCSPTSYLISAGSSPGRSNLGAVSVERQTRLRLPAPPGVYYVRVAAVNTSGPSAASNEVQVTVDGACAAPGPPDRFAAEVSGTTVSMRWQPPLTGGWPTGYILEAGSDPVSSDLVRLPVGGLSFTAQAGNGVYFVRARAANACGTSAASLTYPVLIGPPPAARVTLTASDGVGLAGAYFPPLSRTHAPALLLLHEAFENRRAWDIFAVMAQRRGYAVLQLDLRGHGESSGASLPISALSMHLDVDAALAWLRARPEVNPARIGAAGASLGANLALQGGARHADARSLALLSPGVTLFLIRAFPAIVDYGTRPVLMAAAEGHPIAAESVRQMAAAALGPVETHFYEGGFDGTQLLRAYPELNTLLLDHFDRTVP